MPPVKRRDCGTLAGLADRSILRICPGPIVRIGCLLLAAALFGQTANPAQAQETLVNSIRSFNSGTYGIHAFDLAQEFTTGPASYGYDIDSVVLALGTVGTNGEPGSALRVTIREDSGGIPADYGVELTRVSPLVENGNNEFRVRGGEQLQLSPSASYWVVVEDRNGTLNTAFWTVVSRPGDSNFGWDLSAPARRTVPGPTWASDIDGDVLQLEIKGTEATTPPPAVPVAEQRKRALGYNLASIGRTITATVVEHIWDRAARLEPGGDATLAMVGGRVMDTGAFAERGDPQRMSRAIASALLGRTQGAAVNAPTLRSDPNRPGNRALIPDDRALLGQTRLNLASGGGTGSLAFWGRGDFTAFESDGGDSFPGFSTEGEVASGHVGIDYRVNQETLIGVAVGRSKGETSHTFTAGGDRHDTMTELLSVYPYLYLKPEGSNRVWWAMVGHGTGDATLTEGTSRATTGLSLRTYGIGVREVSSLDAMKFAAKADAFLTEIVADTVSSGSIYVGATTTKASRVRAAFEGTRDWALEGDTTLSGTVEIGFRVDSRDAASGKGADIAGKLHYASPGTGLNVTARGSTLLAHDASGYKEWGVGLLLVYDPGIPGQGLRLTLSPSWNKSRSGVTEAQWNAGSVSRRTPSDQGAALGARLGYAMNTLHDRMLTTVYGEVGSDHDTSRVRVGAELQPTGAARFGLHVYGEREDRKAGNENTLGLHLDLVF